MKKKSPIIIYWNETIENKNSKWQFSGIIDVLQWKKNGGVLSKKKERTFD